MKSKRFLTAVAGACLVGSLVAMEARQSPASDDDEPCCEVDLFARDNLIAWCIVPFDAKQRDPEQRAEMLQRLGFKHFAYDWRAEHIPTWDAEIEALKRKGISLDAFWVAPGELNDDSRRILDTLKRHELRAQLWALLDLGPDRVQGDEQLRRVKLAADRLRPLAEEAAKIGSTVVLYNHGGWFGEPENQIAIIERLKREGITNLGIVYNLHHGHDHLDRFPTLLKQMMPYLKALNLNGMDPGGDRVGRKILPLGQGSLDLSLLKTIRDSGYQGPIGILGHTMDDAEERLKDNLDGLDWLVPQLDGKPPGPRPTPRTPVPPRPTDGTPRADAAPDDRAVIADLIAQAQAKGDATHGAEVFASLKYACLTCHRVGTQGGSVGPDLSAAGLCVKPEELVESVLWPKRKVKEGFEALTIATQDGTVRQGYRLEETAITVALRDPTTGERFEVAKSEIGELRQDGSLMPEGLASAMAADERRDLVRFLLDLGKPGSASADALARQAHAPAEFAFDRAPLRPEWSPSWQAHVNRDRVYDWYAKQAGHFLKIRPTPALLPAFPGMDGGQMGHWGNQNEDTWVDARWNETDLGNVLSGVFRGADVTVPKGVCVRLGEHGELSACFNPETLCYEAVWRGGFVRFSPTRHGFLDGLILDGQPMPRPEGQKPADPFAYRGFYRHGNRVVFAYEVDGVAMLDAPWVNEQGEFTRTVAPASEHPLARLTRGGGAARWPRVFATKGFVGKSGPYAIDAITPPFENPWKAPLFFGGLDFFPDGTALLCTMQGDVWRVEGLDESLANVRWRRYASGLHQALGLVIAEGKVYVLGRDQITRLHDLDGDGEADFHECFSNAYITSTAGHDFIDGLERDGQGRFYTASSKQGVIAIAPDGRTCEVLATGFRNPDGLGLLPDGTITVPSSEGEWTPASMISEIRRGGHYGYPGPRDLNTPPDLPLVYLPRGLDNSSGGQVFAASDRFGPLGGQLLHLSFGSGNYFLVLREHVDGQPQGAIVPMPGEFRSGIHRGRINPADGQLYVAGMAGWGSYTIDDGCFQRVRYTGDPAQVPTAFHAHANGVIITFSRPLDRAIATQPANHLAQAWNYRYSAGYGSPEFSTRHPGVLGHDPLTIRSAHVLDDGRTLFLELPEIQPVNQLHLHVQPDGSGAIDLFATVHRLAPAFTGLPDYRPEPKTIAAHPILADMAALAIKPAPNPWREPIPGSRRIQIEAGKNLSFTLRSFRVRAGEPIRLTLSNPDVVPHNWALVRPGTLSRVGDLANKLIAEPDAASRHYVPKTDDVLVYTDIVAPQEQFSISFKAPSQPGRYPYLCTFPGHWMVMNGEMIVE